MWNCLQAKPPPLLFKMTNVPIWPSAKPTVPQEHLLPVSHSQYNMQMEQLSPQNLQAQMELWPLRTCCQVFIPLPNKVFLKGIFWIPHLSRLLWSQTVMPLYNFKMISVPLYFWKRWIWTESLWLVLFLRSKQKLVWNWETSLLVQMGL